MPGDRALTVVTWNLQGRAGLDAAAVARVLTRFGADVVALQEVQRGQARAVSDRLGADWHGVWGFKHWPVVNRSEGLAVLSRHPITASRIEVLRPAMPVRSTRRVAVVADCDVAGRRVRVASVHLSPAAGDGRWRQRELDQLGGADPDVVLGDLNVADLGELQAVLSTHGWTDCWDPSAGTGCTHWAGGPRPEQAPDRRIDYVLAAPHLSPVSASVPDGPDTATLATLSDHLPLVVHLDCA